MVVLSDAGYLQVQLGWRGLHRQLGCGEQCAEHKSDQETFHICQWFICNAMMGCNAQDIVVLAGAHFGPCLLTGDSHWSAPTVVAVVNIWLLNACKTLTREVQHSSGCCSQQGGEDLPSKTSLASPWRPWVPRWVMPLFEFMLASLKPDVGCPCVQGVQQQQHAGVPGGGRYVPALLQHVANCTTAALPVRSLMNPKQCGRHQAWHLEGCRLCRRSAHTSDPLQA